MKIFKSKFFVYFPFALFLLVTTGISTVSALGNSERDAAAGLVDFPVIEISPERISKLHSSFQAEVEAGQVDLDKGQQAQNIWIALQQYLADQAAKIHRLENRVMEPAGGTRLKAIREVARNAAERERIIISAYLALMRLADDSSINFEDLNYRQNIKETAPEEAGQNRNVEIEISPTDALIEVLE